MTAIFLGRITSPLATTAPLHRASFFYLNEHGLGDGFKAVTDVCEAVFALDDEEKKKYDVGASGNSFG